MVLNKKLLLLPLFFVATIANADTYHVHCDDAGANSAGDFGYVSALYQGKISLDFATTSSSTVITEMKVQLKKHGSATTGSVQGVLYSGTLSNLTFLASSTNSVVVSTGLTTTWATSTFTFNNIQVATSTKVYVGVYRTTVDTQPVYWNRCPINSPTGTHSVYLTGTTTTDSAQDFELTTTAPTSGGGGSTTTQPTTTVDMASTTEAIYAVGYSIQIYMGILLMILFGYMGFVFVRYYI